MFKIKSLVCILVLFAISSAQQFMIKNGFYLRTVDSFGAYNLSTLKTVAGRLNLKAPDKIPKHLLAVYRNDKALFGFAYWEMAFKTSEISQATIERDRLDASKEKTYFSCFQMLLREPQKIKTNSYLFINSAYEQELNPSIKSNDSLFYDLPDINKAGLRKSTWICPVWGFYRIGKDNPFHKPKIFIEEGLFGTLDAFFLGMAIASPFLSENSRKSLGPAVNTNNKFVAPLLSLSAMLLLRWSANLIVNINIRKYDIIKNSRYRLPISIKP
jgi:hypothetical protein